MRFRGLDDSEKVKGISNFKRVILEEVSQFNEVDLKQIRKRLRGRANQQIIGIFNPISEEHWIKINVFDKENLTEITTNISGKWINSLGNTVILKTNYLDNKFIVGDGNGGGYIDQHTIDDFEPCITFLPISLIMNILGKGPLAVPPVRESLPPFPR